MKSVTIYEQIRKHPIRAEIDHLEKAFDSLGEKIVEVNNDLALHEVEAIRARAELIGRRLSDYYKTFGKWVCRVTECDPAPGLVDVILHWHFDEKEVAAARRLLDAVTKLSHQDGNVSASMSAADAEMLGQILSSICKNFESKEES